MTAAAPHLAVPGAPAQASAPPGGTAAEPLVVTFGCRLNVYESEVMRDLARAGGRAGTVIVHSCAVTGEAERQARQAIRRLRREHPEAEIVVTGCAAQVHPERFAAMPEVSRVLGNLEKLRPESWQATEGAPRVAVGDVLARPPAAAETAPAPAQALLTAFGARTRAFVEVQNGCDHRCTFCIIPYGRGPSRSLALGAVVTQVRTLVAAGYREVVLTGVDLTSYGGDLPGQPPLGQMVRRLLALVPELPRLRLSSIDVAEVDDDLLRLLAEEPRLMPHLHLSLQAGDDMILKRMKRRHSVAQAVALCATARRLRPGLALGADLIAGFPTEDEAAFANTLAHVEDCGLTQLHVFPFSARTGTPAARMPQVPGDVRKARAARLRAAGAVRQAADLAAQVGGQTSVLVETQADGLAQGHSPRYDVVRVAGVPQAASGDLLTVRVTAAAADHLEAVPA